MDKRATTMAQEGALWAMAVNCTLTFQYKLLTLIQLGQVGSLTTTTPLSRKRWHAYNKPLHNLTVS